MLLKRNEVLKMTGFSKATLYRRIDEALFAPSCTTGGKSVAFLADEVTQIIQAYSLQLPNEELKNIVQQLIEARSQL